MASELDFLRQSKFSELSVAYTSAVNCAAPLRAIYRCTLIWRSSYFGRRRGDEDGVGEPPFAPGVNVLGVGEEVAFFSVMSAFRFLRS